MITTLDVLSRAYDRCVYGYSKYCSADIDYASFEQYKQIVRNQDNWFEMKLNPFGNEGLYIDIYFCQDCDSQKVYCGCVKTLRDDREAFRDMGALMGEMLFWGNKLIYKLMKREWSDGLLHGIQADNSELFWYES